MIAPTGCYLTQDPVGLAGGSNLYSYAGGNPVSFSDPFGLASDSVEVIIWRAAGSGSSSAGHMSVRVDGTSYSWGPTGRMDVRDFAEYRGMQGFREGLGLQLNLTAEQESAFVASLRSGQGKYNTFVNNCTDPVENGLESLGSKLGLNWTPLGTANAIIATGLVTGTTNYPQLEAARGFSAPWATSK